MMQADTWNQIHQILLEHGVLNQALDVDQAYTLEFVEAVYRQ